MSYTEIGGFFRYPKGTFNIRELQLTYEGPIKHHLLVFESPLVTPYAENNTTYFHWYEPVKRSNLALLVIHDGGARIAPGMKRKSHGMVPSWGLTLWYHVCHIMVDVHPKVLCLVYISLVHQMRNVQSMHSVNRSWSLW